MATAWWLARSPTRSETPSTTIDEHREQHQHRRVVGQARAEPHHAVLGPRRSGDDREAEHEQRVREQRAEDRGLGDHRLTGGEGEEDDEELGEVAERRLEDARDRGAEAGADRLGTDPDHPGEPGKRQPADDEGHDGLVGRVVQDAGERRCDERDRDEDAAPQGAANPIRSYIVRSVGSDAARAFSAPLRRSRSSSAGSAASSV